MHINTSLLPTYSVQKSFQVLRIFVLGIIVVGEEGKKETQTGCECWRECSEKGDRKEKKRVEGASLYIGRPQN